MPRATSAANVRFTRSAFVSSRPSNESSIPLVSLRLVVSALSRRTLDSREVDRCIRPIFPLDRLDAPSIPVDARDQACGVDSQVLRRVSPHLVRSPLKERDRAREVAVLEMVVGRADLDQTLEEESWLAMLLAPDLLEDLVGLEEVFLVEQADSLLDRVQTGTVRDGRHPAGRTNSHGMKLAATVSSRAAARLRRAPRP